MNDDKRKRKKKKSKHITTDDKVSRTSFEYEKNGIDISGNLYQANSENEEDLKVKRKSKKTKTKSKDNEVKYQELVTSIKNSEEFKSNDLGRHTKKKGESFEKCIPNLVSPRIDVLFSKDKRVKPQVSNSEEKDEVNINYSNKKYKDTLKNNKSKDHQRIKENHAYSLLSDDADSSDNTKNSIKENQIKIKHGKDASNKISTDVEQTIQNQVGAARDEVKVKKKKRSKGSNVPEIEAFGDAEYLTDLNRAAPNLGKLVLSNTKEECLNLEEISTKRKEKIINISVSESANEDLGKLKKFNGFSRTEEIISGTNKLNDKVKHRKQELHCVNISSDLSDVNLNSEESFTYYSSKSKNRHKERISDVSTVSTDENYEGKVKGRKHKKQKQLEPGKEEKNYSKHKVFQENESPVRHSIATIRGNNDCEQGLDFPENNKKIKKEKVIETSVNENNIDQKSGESKNMNVHYSEEVTSRAVTENDRVKYEDKKSSYIDISSDCLDLTSNSENSYYLSSKKKNRNKEGASDVSIQVNNESDEAKTKKRRRKDDICENKKNKKRKSEEKWGESPTKLTIEVLNNDIVNGIFTKSESNRSINSTDNLDPNFETVFLKDEMNLSDYETVEEYKSSDYVSERKAYSGETRTSNQLEKSKSPPKAVQESSPNTAFSFGDILSQSHKDRLAQRFNDIVGASTSDRDLANTNDGPHVEEKSSIAGAIKKSESTSRSSKSSETASKVWSKLQTLDNYVIRTQDLEKKKKQKVIELLEQSKSIEEIEEELDISNVEEKEKVQELDIQTPWSIPLVHRIAHYSSNHPSADQRNALLAAGIHIKKGKYTKEEDEKIRRNWRNFCENHKWDESNYQPFLKCSKNAKNGVLSRRQFHKFVQCISHDFDDRLKYNIYLRFQRLFSLDSRDNGRFTEEDDKIIMEHVDNGGSNVPFADLADILQRSRLAILKRYQLLKLKGTSNVERVYFDKPLTEKLLAYLIEVTCSINLSDLKDRHITPQEWQKVSKKMNICIIKLKRAWLEVLYPRFFGNNYSEDLHALRMKLIDLILTKYNDWREINWYDLAKEVNNGSTHTSLCKMFWDTVSGRVPPRKRGNLRKALKFMRETLEDRATKSHARYTFVKDILKETKNGTIIPKIAEEKEGSLPAGEAANMESEDLF